MREYRLIYEWKDGLFVTVTEDDWTKAEWVAFMKKIKSEIAEGAECYLEERKVSPWRRINA